MYIHLHPPPPPHTYIHVRAHFGTLEARVHAQYTHSTHTRTRTRTQHRDDEGAHVAELEHQPPPLGAGPGRRSGWDVCMHQCMRAVYRTCMYGEDVLVRLGVVCVGGGMLLQLQCGPLAWWREGRMTTFRGLSSHSLSLVSVCLCLSLSVSVSLCLLSPSHPHICIDTCVHSRESTEARKDA